jgi:hypothetical protein
MVHLFRRGGLDLPPRRLSRDIGTSLWADS